ncbi:MAG: adenosylcobinamide amidohydrolase [Acidimicrobiales bacterium]|nr:MAG: adenosylcobinamide amidohydrolase [Acidimicrobiales bacterium]
MQPSIRLRREGNQNLPVLVWRFPSPMLAVSSAPLGGGLGPRRWVVNAQVPPSYARRDPEHHLAKLGRSLGLPGNGVGMLTAADVRRLSTGEESGVVAVATCGLAHPTMAADPSAELQHSAVGTVNLVCILPARLSPGALVNAVVTATEAKAQAFAENDIPGTGTATDAVCILCPQEGVPWSFGGPRSRWGAPLALAVHRAVGAGIRRWREGR